VIDSLVLVIVVVVVVVVFIVIAVRNPKLCSRKFNPDHDYRVADEDNDKNGKSECYNS
jgi:hypothetical protein